MLLPFLSCLSLLVGGPTPVCTGGPPHLLRHTSPFPHAKGGSSCLWTRQLGGFCVDWVVVRLGLASHLVSGGVGERGQSCVRGGGVLRSLMSSSVVWCLVMASIVIISLR